MDRYQFPHITHISQCLEAIKGCDAFHVAERDRHTIINYHQMGNDVFPPVNVYRSHDVVGMPFHIDYDAAIRRECRGIVFGPDGRVIARRLHKFFNAGEREEVSLDKISFDGGGHVILEKLDGSMITPIPIGDHIRWGTKMGLTEVGFQAEEFVSTRKNYVDMAKHHVHYGLTPIFEWCSRKQRIVVDYPEDKLVLIAIRNNVTGDYADYSTMKNIGSFWKVPVVGLLHGYHVSFDRGIHDLIEEMSKDTHEAGQKEGYVVRYLSGHMLKIKYSDYVRIHRAKDSILQEKRVVEMVLNEKVDDVLPHLIDHDREALSSFNDDFWREMTKAADQIAFVLGAWKDIVKADRKRFALEAQIDMKVKSICFSLWDKPVTKQTVLDEMVSRVSENFGSQTNVDGARWMWGGIRWSDYLKGAEDEAA